MNDDGALLLEALAAAMVGDRARAATLLIEACPTEDDGWAAACGYASLVCAGVRWSTNVDDHGTITAVAVADPNAGPTTDDYAQILAAFLAAVGNDDFDGARRMYKTLGAPEGEQRLIVDLLDIAVLVTKRHARREGTS